MRALHPRYTAAIFLCSLQNGTIWKVGAVEGYIQLVVPPAFENRYEP